MSFCPPCAFAASNSTVRSASSSAPGMHCADAPALELALASIVQGCGILIPPGH
ncbi:MAG: hypothetical protein KGI35_17730 [Burkholderiales bacterium]|nr:hypothetical protein [Burkholderiales bacterium]